MERICARCGIHVVIPKGEDLRICPKCKGLLVDDTNSAELALKYSILSKIGIVKKCPEMESLILSRLEQQILYGGGSERPKGILAAGGLNETEM